MAAKEEDPTPSTAAAGDPEMSEKEIAQEREHFKTVVNAFLYYKWVVGVEWVIISIMHAIESTDQLKYMDTLALQLILGLARVRAGLG